MKRSGLMAYTLLKALQEKGFSTKERAEIAQHIGNLSNEEKQTAVKEAIKITESGEPKEEVWKKILAL